MRRCAAGRDSSVPSGSCARMGELPIRGIIDSNRIPGAASGTTLSFACCTPNAVCFRAVKRILFCGGVLLALAGLAAGQIHTANSGTWSGTVVYSSCDADEAFAESAECTTQAPGAQLSLYDDTNRVMYELEPQARATARAGESVTVRGTLEGNTIRVSSVAPMSIGLPVGRKAPAFSAPDQFGQTQTLDSLKGRSGTVLLFFRSADW